MQRKYFKIISAVIIAVFMISPLAPPALAAENVNPNNGRYHTNGQTGTVYATGDDGAEVAIANYGATTEYSQSQRFLSTESYPSFYASVETNSLSTKVGDYAYYPLVVRINASGKNPNNIDLSYTDFRVSDTAVSTMTSPPIDNSMQTVVVDAFNMIYNWLKFVSPFKLPPVTWEAAGASLVLQSDNSHVWVTYSNYIGPVLGPVEMLTWNPTHQRALQFCFDLRCNLQGDYLITVNYEIEYYTAQIVVVTSYEGGHITYTPYEYVSYYKTVTLTDTLKVRYAGHDAIPDTTPPTVVSIVSPHDGDHIMCDQWGVAHVTTYASSLDPESGIGSVEMKDNDFDWVTATYDAATQQYYYIFALASGENQAWHTIQVRAYNNWGYVTTIMSVSVLVIMPPPPTIDSPLDIVYTVGATNQVITWHPSSDFPNKYLLYRDDSAGNHQLLRQFSWDGGAIAVNVNGVSVGTYYYRLVVFDTFNQFASDEVTVTVLSPGPSIDHPPDVSYKFGVGYKPITWNPSSSSPQKYQVTKNGAIVANGAWTGGAITVNAGGLPVGAYTFTCTVWDTCSRSVSDDVVVLVSQGIPIN